MNCIIKKSEGSILYAHKVTSPCIGRVHQRAQSVDDGAVELLGYVERRCVGIGYIEQYNMIDSTVVQLRTRIDRIRRRGLI